MSTHNENEKEIDIIDILEDTNKKKKYLSEYSPKERSAIIFPTGEEVMVDIVKTYSGQFPETKKIMDEHPNLFMDSIVEPKLDGIIAEYIRSLI